MRHNQPLRVDIKLSDLSRDRAAVSTAPSCGCVPHLSSLCAQRLEPEGAVSAPPGTWRKASWCRGSRESRPPDVWRCSPRSGGPFRNRWLADGRWRSSSSSLWANASMMSPPHSRNPTEPMARTISSIRTRKYSASAAWKRGSAHSLRSSGIAFQRPSDPLVLLGRCELGRREVGVVQRLQRPGVSREPLAYVWEPSVVVDGE